MIIMKTIKTLSKALICLLLSGMYACSSGDNSLTVNDETGALSQTSSPVAVDLKLDKKMLAAANEGRLGITLNSEGADGIIPVQTGGPGENSNLQLVLFMADKEPGIKKYNLIENESPFDPVIKADLDPESGQVLFTEDGKKVMQYNYKTIFEKDVMRLDDEKLEEHVRTATDTFLTTSIYAVPRSNYIHPLYGVDGEMLTRDWPDGAHPHHRGIFWAWPEVDYKNERGDIYALQRLFARPTGKIKLTSGPVFAQVEAENLWMWEDTKAIVREDVVIRVYKASTDSRIVDLTVRLVALEDSITIATRATNSYGGLNIRMMTPEEQEIAYFTDEPGAQPLRAWSDFNGIFDGCEAPSGLMVLQHKSNPEYPGAWVEYPNLAWVQPTFPTPETRYALLKGKPLVLRYRMIAHSEGKPGKELSEKRWDAYNGTLTPLSDIETTNN
jgi:hypothetical protein